MFKKVLLTIGALLVSTQLGFAQEEQPAPNCHPLAEIQNDMKHDKSVVVATMTNAKVGAMALITDPSGDWYFIYFKGSDQICIAAGGTNLTFAPPPAPPSEDVAK